MISGKKLSSLAGADAGVQIVISHSFLELRAMVARRLHAYGAFEGCTAEDLVCPRIVYTDLISLMCKIGFPSPLRDS